MNYDEARASQKQIRDANERSRIGLIQKFQHVRINLDRIAADLVSLKQKANNNAANSGNQPPLPPMPEADAV